MQGEVSERAGAPLRLIPLGGLGEFGLNSLLIDWEGHRLLVDAGAMFASAELPGVDSVVPDFRTLADGGQLHGIVLTHGHDDHIAALPFALRVAQAPVFGSRLTLALARKRLRDRGVTADLRLLDPAAAVNLGPFRVHAIRVAHSVLDAYALAIETPAGVIVASGDFKMGLDGPADERTDVARLAEWGDRGVLALLSDSTNVERQGHTASEDDVVPAFERVFEETKGRILVSCFATSIPRMQRVVDVALRHGRRVGFVGRRMVDNTDAAIDLGLLRMPSAMMGASPASTTPASTALFVSGSQGEPFSALSLISNDEHRDVAVGPGDTVVLSARTIPGNERVVSRMISNLYRRGCEVVHPGVAKVHVSGHGSHRDLVDLIGLTRPRYLMPVHGEFRMLAQHARLAASAGLTQEQILLAEDGDVYQVSSEGARLERRAEAGRMLLDRGGDGGLDDLVVRDRRHLSSDGIVVPVVVVDKRTGRLDRDPEILSRGFTTAHGEHLLAEASRLVARSVESGSREEPSDASSTRERLRLDLRRFFRKRVQRRPMVIPVVMEV